MISRFLGAFGLAAALVAGAACGDCGGSSEVEPDASVRIPADAGGADAGTTVTTALFGQVRDEAGEPVGGVLITAHGKTATSAADGTWAIPEVTVPAGRLFAVAKKAGYISAPRATTPVAGGATRLRFVLLAATTQPVGAAGGKVEDQGGAVQFPADAFGAEVQVAARLLSTDHPQFDSLFPGDLNAKREDGSEAALYSFGVMHVEIKDSAGADAPMAAGAKATVTIPVPAGQAGSAPATIPLWYFDEQAGIWKEEGVATLQGNLYVGEVKHFTSWNADKPAITAYVTGRVACGGTPFGGVYVSSAQSGTSTGPDGRFKMAVPADLAFELRVNSTTNDGVFSMATPRPVDPIPPQTTRDVGDLLLDVCPAKLTGSVVGCTGSPISGAVRATWSGGSTTGYALAGAFELLVPADTDVSVVASADGVSSTPASVRSGAGGSTTAAGSLKACGDTGGCGYRDIATQARYLAFSPDGKMLAGPYGEGVELIDVATGAVLRTLTSGAGDTSQDWAQFSGDGKRISVTSFYSGVPRIFDVATGVVVRLITSPVLESSVFLPGGTEVVGVDNGDHLLKLVSVDSGQVSKTYAIPKATKTVTFLGLRAGGTQAIALTGVMDAAEEITVWDLAQDSQVVKFSPGATYLTGARTAVLSADGALLALPVLEGALATKTRFFDTLTGQRATPQDLETSYCGSVAIRPDKQAVAFQAPDVAGKDGSPTVAAFPSLTTIRTLPWLGGDVRDLAWSPDGTQLAGLKDGKVVRIWDMTTCK